MDSVVSASSAHAGSWPAGPWGPESGAPAPRASRAWDGGGIGLPVGQKGWGLAPGRGQPTPTQGLRVLLVPLWVGGAHFLRRPDHTGGSQDLWLPAAHRPPAACTAATGQRSCDVVQAFLWQEPRALSGPPSEGAQVWGSGYTLRGSGFSRGLCSHTPLPFAFTYHGRFPRREAGHALPRQQSPGSLVSPSSTPRPHRSHGHGLICPPRCACWCPVHKSPIPLFLVTFSDFGG